MTSIFSGINCKSIISESFNAIKSVDAIGCRNESYALHVKKALDLKKMPFICYSGIPDETAELQLKNIGSVVLTNDAEYVYVGRLVKYKNVDVIIKALNVVYSDKCFKLHIIGTGAEQQNLENLANDLGLTANVIFHGQMPRDDVFELMKRCYCFIMVSDNETFGMVYIEAMLAGCITIASKGGGVDGIIVDGKNGFLSEQGNVDALAMKVKEINNLPEEERNIVRKQGILSAYEYKDTNVALKYLNDVLTFSK